MRVDRLKIIVEMARRGLRGVELAQLAGVSRATITAIRGGKSCSRESAERIAKALGVDVTEIMEDAGIDNSKGF